MTDQWLGVRDQSTTFSAGHFRWPRERPVYLGTASKFLHPGLRLLGEGHLDKSVRAARRFYAERGALVEPRLGGLGDVGDAELEPRWAS